MEPILQLWISWPHARADLASLSSDHVPSSVSPVHLPLPLRGWAPGRSAHSQVPRPQPGAHTPGQCDWLPWCSASAVLATALGHMTSFGAYDALRRTGIAFRLRESRASERLSDLPEVTQLGSGRQDLNQDLVASRLWGSRRRLQGPEPGPTALGRDQPLPLVVTRSGRCPQPLPWTRHVAVSSSCPSTPTSPANVFIRGDRGTGEVLAPLGRTAHAGHGSLAGLREPGLSPRARAACAFYRSLPCEHLLTLPGGRAQGWGTCYHRCSVLRDFRIWMSHCHLGSLKSTESLGN